LGAITMPFRGGTRKSHSMRRQWGHAGQFRCEENQKLDFRLGSET
jgi:hypothetical protein